MNFNDTDVLRGILSDNIVKNIKSSNIGDDDVGTCTKYKLCDSEESADVVLLMTCAIRENAEQRIWNRLDELQAIKSRKGRRFIVGILGCMAERLKGIILERKKVADIICGPDGYRDLPKLIQDAFEGHQGMSVVLSSEETYADIAPVRADLSSKTAFVSIMRGCNNMCSFCIVPFTRGRERSRNFYSIIEEVKLLADQGVKEITLLGQNVNSYVCTEGPVAEHQHKLAPGFKTVYKPSNLNSARFFELLDTLSSTFSDIRFRFTSPHPKDFPEHLIELIKERKNICKQIHLPAQSGSSAVLERMRRGYTSEAYIQLIQRIRQNIPDIALSSDFIVGFCGETETNHQDTISLVKAIGYDMAYMYAYSMRDKTHAHRNYEDDVPEDVKGRRLRELIDTFYATAKERARSYINTRQLVLVEGVSKKAEDELSGRADNNRIVVFPKRELNGQKISLGDLIDVHVTDVSGMTLRGIPVKHTSISDFSQSFLIDNSQS